ncbi:hypothetical protein CKAH01_05976 [Colletotrichum kahawae]|uniref:Uncharacterized protein n=1 Tax=Colletotrichum kahawae TaxID=34407 RepID=A0AAE0D3S9_COLKA|nr:hypothetical protein CKAH01_05976 [Colletotrichum kahawae]
MGYTVVREWLRTEKIVVMRHPNQIQTMDAAVDLSARIRTDRQSMASTGQTQTQTQTQTPPNPSMETQPLRFKAVASLRSQALELRTSCCRSGPPWEIRQWTRGLLSSNPQAVGYPFSFMQGTRPQRRRSQWPPVRHESWRRSG